MDTGLYVVMPLIAVFILDFIIFLNLCRNRINSKTHNIFTHFAVMVLIMMTCTIVTYSCEMGLFSLSRVFLYCLYIIAIVSMISSSYFWFHYLLLLISNKPMSMSHRIMYALPVLVLFFACVASPYTHWVFFINSSGCYERGTLYFLQVAGPYIYTVMGFFAVLAENAYGDKKRNRKILRNFIVFVIPSIVGVLVQCFIIRGGYTQMGINFGMVLIFIEQYMEEVSENKQLKRIETMNVQLKIINQEKESQLEEIKALNTQLQENQDNLKSRFEIIQSMTSIYFASYYIDVDMDTYSMLQTKPNIVEVVKNEGKAQEALNVVCEKLILPEYKERMLEFFDLSTIKERLRDKNAVSAEYIGVTSGWSMAYLIAGDRDEEGLVRHIFYAARYNNDEKAREDAQRKQLEEYNDIIANAGLGIWHIIIKDGEEPRMQPNRKMLELLDIKDSKMSEEEIYKWWYGHISKEALPSVEKSVREMLDMHFSENTYLWEHPSKGPIYVRCGGTCEYLEDGSKVLSGYHADVTSIVLQEEYHKKELEMAREAAEAANEAKSSFLFNMSHDIRTPMNAIMGYTDILEKNLGDVEKCADCLKKIKSSNEVLLSIINNVLEMARIENGKVAVNEKAMEVRQVGSRIKSLMEGLWIQKNITFTDDVRLKHNYLFVDEDKVQKIILNILSNACKYTEPGGKVCLKTEELPCEKEGYTNLRISVSDTGRGMTQEFLEHIFEDFSREHTSTESKIEGTGLGMHIVKILVDLLGGSIEVESQIGVGSTFIVTLCHKIASEDDLDDKKIEYDVDWNAADFSGKRILLAEDNDLNAEISTEILGERGFLVERAENGQVTLDMLLSHEPFYYDVILMDIQMPVMNGYEATRAIRALNNEDYANTPILAMTANAFDEDKQEALEAGMDGHLTKPIDIKTLTYELMSVLPC